MKKRLIQILKYIGLYKTFKVPKNVISRYIFLTNSESNSLESIITDFVSSNTFETEENRKKEIQDLYMGRLSRFRNNHIPFLDEHIRLKNKNILEIGCGTGASSIALAEQGAYVTGIDIVKESVKIAQKRASIYKLPIEFIQLNATEIESHLKHKHWDVIIFFASIEHMLPSERKSALQQSYSMLKEGGFLCILGTPNRLWPVDIHTSYLPFYMWLQDELALDYARFSKRKEFASLHKLNIEKGYEDLYHLGRGFSFHELEIALGPISKLRIIESLPIFLRKHNFFQKWSYQLSDEYKFKKLLSKYGPKGIHPGFYECYIDLIIKK